MVTLHRHSVKWFKMRIKLLAQSYSCRMKCSSATAHRADRIYRVLDLRAATTLVGHVTRSLRRPYRAPLLTNQKLPFIILGVLQRISVGFVRDYHQKLRVVLNVIYQILLSF